MITFYGTKKVKSAGMTRLEYNVYRGWELPDDENGNDDGYLVEYLDGGDGNHPNHEGYISWSPMAQFDAAYQEASAMNFGHALVVLKGGGRVARAGWNGKGMWIAIQDGSTITASQARGGVAKLLADEMEAGPPHDNAINILPHIDMRTADGSIVVGWLASQSDMLADDWAIV